MDFRDLISASSIKLTNPALSRVIGNLIYSAVSLDFNMQAQTQSNWCWAATSTSVSHFYISWSPWTQCKVANGELGRSDCCNSSVPGPCNVSWYLDLALTRTENFVSVTSSPVDFDTVRAEIVAGRPVGARIGWSGGGGHFMVIYGCARIGATRYFYIDDPIYGKSQPTVDTFTNSYQGSGSWTHTYFTKRAPLIHFRPYLIPERVFQIIWEARPLLHLAETAAATDRPNLSLGLAHPVYNAGLDLLRARKLPDSASHVRVFELEGDKPRAFFDMDTGETAQVRTAAAANPYLELFERGASELLRSNQHLESEAELRLFQAPALYVDALWLHFDQDGKDLFLPIRSPFGPEPFRVYTQHDFLEALAKRAADRKTDDDRIAP